MRGSRIQTARGQRSTHPGHAVHSSACAGHLCARHSGYTAVPGGVPASQSPRAGRGHTPAAALGRSHALATDGHTGSRATSSSPGSGRPGPVKAELETVLACPSLGRSPPNTPRRRSRGCSSWLRIRGGGPGSPPASLPLKPPGSPNILGKHINPAPALPLAQGRLRRFRAWGRVETRRPRPNTGGEVRPKRVPSDPVPRLCLDLLVL